MLDGDDRDIFERQITQAGNKGSLLSTALATAAIVYAATTTVGATIAMTILPWTASLGFAALVILQRRDHWPTVDKGVKHNSVKTTDVWIAGPLGALFGQALSDSARGIGYMQFLDPYWAAFIIALGIFALAADAGGIAGRAYFRATTKLRP